MLGRSNPVLRLARTIRGAVRPVPLPVPARPRTTRVIGHRGAARLAPENTIESFRCALDLGADAIETDVCVTSDGVFVLWHDADPSETIALARETGRECLAYTPDVPTLLSRHRRPIRRLTFDEFRAQYGYRRRQGGLADLAGGDGPAPVAPATLDDLLRWSASEPRLAGICLDVKLAPSQTEAARALYQHVAEFVARRRTSGVPEIRLLTPEEEILRVFLAEARSTPHDHRLRVSADFELPGVLGAARRLGFRDVSMGLGRRIWPGFRDEVMQVVRARENGALDSVIVWTIGEPDRLRELVGARVDGVLTDDPSLLSMIVKESRRWERSAASPG